MLWSRSFWLSFSPGGIDCFRVGSKDDSDSDTPVINIPYIVSDHNGSSDHESAFILTCGSHLSQFNGGMSFEELPTPKWDTEIALALGITELPLWHVLVPYIEGMCLAKVATMLNEEKKRLL